MDIYDLTRENPLLSFATTPLTKSLSAFWPIYGLRRAYYSTRLHGILRKFTSKVRSRVPHLNNQVLTSVGLDGIRDAFKLVKLTLQELRFSYGTDGVRTAIYNVRNGLLS